MSEQSPGSGSEQRSGETVPSVASSGDGADSVDVTAMPADPVAVEEDVAAEDADERSVFLVELVRAIQVTASLERMRTVEQTERRREAHIDRIRARQTSEADRMRELAGEDMAAIDAWVDDESRRVQVERERRATELHQDLETSLEEHRARIDREIELVEAAIASHRADVDAFFEGLDRETDLTQLAQQAPMRPIFPRLDGLAATLAGTSEVTAETPPAGADDSGTDEVEPAGVGVMDLQAEAEPVASWSTPPETDQAPETSPDLDPVEAVDNGDQRGEAGEPTEPVTATTGPGRGGLLLAAVPTKRPMSWLRRDANDGDRSNGDG